MIQIIDYGAGNLKSVTNALQKLDFNYSIITSPEEINPDSKIIFPGVGAAGTAMQILKSRGFNEIIPQIKNPFLGICLGMQLLLSYSEEDKANCLNVINGQVRKFSGNIKVPQIGWNTVDFSANNKLFSGIKSGECFYFVNSYYVDPDQKYILGQTNYAKNFASVIKNNNFYGVQFHPEKSGEIGLKLLSNFCKLC